MRMKRKYVEESGSEQNPTSEAVTNVVQGSQSLAPFWFSPTAPSTPTHSYTSPPPTSSGSAFDPLPQTESNNSSQDDYPEVNQYPLIPFQEERLISDIQLEAERTNKEAQETLEAYIHHFTSKNGNVSVSFWNVSTNELLHYDDNFLHFVEAGHFRLQNKFRWVEMFPEDPPGARAIVRRAIDQSRINIFDYIKRLKNLPFWTEETEITFISGTGRLKKALVRMVSLKSSSPELGDSACFATELPDAVVLDESNATNSTFSCDDHFASLFTPPTVNPSENVTPQSAPQSDQEASTVVSSAPSPLSYFHDFASSSPPASPKNPVHLPTTGCVCTSSNPHQHSPSASVTISSSPPSRPKSPPLQSPASPPSPLSSVQNSAFATHTLVAQGLEMVQRKKAKKKIEPWKENASVFRIDVAANPKGRIKGYSEPSSRK